MNPDAAVIGSGPNGLAAAITLAQAGLTVEVFEAADQIGGGVRSAQWTLPGFLHDTCSAVHPMARLSPFFRTLPLEKHGLKWIHPPCFAAHPLDDGSAVVLEPALEAASSRLGRDAEAYRDLLQGWVHRAEWLYADLLGPLRFPRHLWLVGDFGLHAMRSVRSLVMPRFELASTRAFLGGIGGHALIPLDRSLSAAVMLMLAIAGHAAGWPLPEGGSQRLSEALASVFRSLGGQVQVNAPVRSLSDLPPCRLTLFDTSPRQLVSICGDKLPKRYSEKLLRFQHGPGVFKMDFALAGPVPWKNPRTSLAATVHLGGSFEELAASEREVFAGEHPDRPFTLVTQPSLFDPSRAPSGQHALWAYCHVPNGSTLDMSERIERQIERFAPGFHERILARHTFSPSDLERYNPNYVGGDIGGGALNWRQFFTRPVSLTNPYATPLKGVYLCSASTPPGPAVHGMCGYHAARRALREL